MRSGNVERKTLETGISAEINGVLMAAAAAKLIQASAFDHMLTLLAKHSFSDLVVHAVGDLDVDSHHTVEDCGIVLGQALKEAVGDKAGIHRYGNCFCRWMRRWCRCALISVRPYLIFDADIPKVQLGIYDAEMTEESFRALAMQAGLTLHIRVLYGKNTHHIIEAIFKGFARVLAEAVAFDSRVHGVMSSKGTL